MAGISLNELQDWMKENGPKFSKDYEKGQLMSKEDLETRRSIWVGQVSFVLLVVPCSS